MYHMKHINTVGIKFYSKYAAKNADSVNITPVSV